MTAIIGLRLGALYLHLININGMKPVQLEFQNMQVLWQFKVESELDALFVNVDTNTLVCFCQTWQVELALTKYHAKEVTKGTLTAAAARLLL